MDSKEYLEQSSRTVSRPDLEKHEEYAQNNTASMNLLYILENFIQSGIVADITKRKVYYNDNDRSLENRKIEAMDKVSFDVVSLDRNSEVKNEEVDLFHAILGMVSEVGEICENVLHSYAHGKKIDKNNLSEEIGDLLWYIALFLRYTGSDFETEFNRNIEKLKKRFPDKFTIDNALNRNIEKEQEVFNG